MDSYIKGVAIFKDNTEKGKRVLPLDRGLNIITGHSKTGKSAILDIIDWVLGARECTIPQGTITDFATMYCAMIEMNGVNLLLGREQGRGGNKFMFFQKREPNDEIKNIQFEDFQKKHFCQIKDALKFINEVIGLNEGNENLIDVDFKIPNVNIRSALPFNFQHQDIIKSNRKIFYLDPIKSHFPVIAGWFNSEYFLILESIKKYKARVEKLEKEKNASQDFNKTLINNVKLSLRHYYNLINVSFNDKWTINECLKRIIQLEEFEIENSDNSIINRQDELEELLEQLISQKTGIDRQISTLETQQKHGQNYKSMLEKYEQRNQKYDLNDEYTCPICEKTNESLTIHAIEILKADEWLKKELSSLPSQNNDFETEIAALKLKKTDIVQQAKLLKEENKEITKTLKKIDSEKSINKQRQELQWKVKSEAEIYNSRHIPFDEFELNHAQSRLEEFADKKKSYQESEKYETAKRFIEEQMSLMIELLDFEHRPPDLSFELNPTKHNDYSLYHNIKGKGEIHLRQIGSASNALACHISIFLAFMHYFCKERDSKVPSFLFFDQPSQVYFPSGTDNTDTQKVSDIYKTFINAIDKIHEETGIKPQIIVADHIKDLGDNAISLKDEYFKADWRGGDGLI